MKMFNNMILHPQDALPVLGGTAAAVSSGISQISLLPSLEACVQTFILALIGAMVGYIVKVSLDKVFKRNCK